VSKRTFFLAAALSLAAALPVQASTLPALDAPDTATTVTLGLMDGAFDVGVWDNLWLGAFGSYVWFLPGLTLQGGGARVTYRLGQAGQAAWGVSLAGGYHRLDLASRDDYAWVQPALVASYPIADGVMLRGSFGPMIYQDLNTAHGAATGVSSFGVLPIPDVEVAFLLPNGWEATLGGNGIVGLRAIF